VLRNISLKKCKVYAFAATGAAFDQVEVDGLQTGPKWPMKLQACVFRHTVFKGPIGQVMFHPTLVAHSAKDRGPQAFLDANADYYRDNNVDWAIDISEMESATFELRGAVPAHLIRRNSADQFVMTKEKAASGKWKKVRGILSSSISIGIEQFLSTGMPDTVFVADRRSKYYKEDLEIYKRLRDAGFLT
jgi:hypothetical protein